MNPKIERALISVSDKTGLTEFCAVLASHGVKLFASGGTRSHLVAAGLDVVEIAEHTGFPEMMDGRIKTLHPRIHGGILSRRDRPDDLANMAEHGILPFELVVVNLYPFEATIAQPEVELSQAIEKIDVGGPTILRGAAKNHAFVTICSKPSQYDDVLREIMSDGCTALATRARLAVEAFELSSQYEYAIAEYLREKLTAAPTVEISGELPAALNIRLKKHQSLRYGENPHQLAAVYVDSTPTPASLVGAAQLNGKELSYNNLLDLDAALKIVRSLDQPAISVIKHNNPCGAAVDSTLSVACRKALDGDPQSAFGSILASNRQIDEACAVVLTEPDQFIEAIVAPGFTSEALHVLTTRPKWKANVRLLAVAPQAILRPSGALRDLEYRAISGGWLVQQADDAADEESAWKVVTTAVPSEAMRSDIRLAWELVRFVKSNAIVVVNSGALVGAGAGQMSRVDSVEIALAKAGVRARGGVLASDAFFPFSDSVHRSHAAGISVLIQPGGSKKDDEVIAACNQLGVAMIFTGVRHFRH